MRTTSSIAKTTNPNTMAERLGTACGARLLALLLLLTLPAAVQAQFEYTTNNDTITIIDYTGPGGAVTIPSTTNGLPVTGIGAHAFDYANLASVTIPDSVTSIGDYAFYHCSGLTNVTIGNSVTSIGFAAFDECLGLTSVAIPNSVTNLGGYAFAHCTSLAGVTLSTNIVIINSRTFAWCDSLTNVTIPNSVTSVA